MKYRIQASQKTNPEDEKRGFHATTYRTECETNLGCPASSYSDIAWMFYRVIQALDFPRQELFFANLVAILNDTESFYSISKDTTKQFMSAANDIIRYWKEHDREIRRRSVAVFEEGIHE